MATLTPDALTTLSEWDVTERQWVSEWFGAGVWRGAPCGCPEADCVPAHHADGEPCRCLRGLLVHRIH